MYIYAINVHNYLHIAYFTKRKYKNDIWNFEGH